MPMLNPFGMDDQSFGKRFLANQKFREGIKKAFPAFGSGAIRVVSKGGEISFQAAGTDRTYRDIHSAMQAVQHYGPSTKREFTPGAVPRTGSYRNSFLELLADRWHKQSGGSSVTRQTFKNYNIQDFHMMMRELVGPDYDYQLDTVQPIRGLVNFDNDTANVMQMLDSKGQPVSMNVMMDFFKKEFGLEINDSPKVMKRMKMLFSDRALTHAQQVKGKENLYRLMTVDKSPERFAEIRSQLMGKGISDAMADEMIGRITDGSSFVDRQVVGDALHEMYKRAVSLRAAGDLQGARDLFHKIDEIHASLSRGTSFNFRMIGLRDYKDKDKIYNGLIKGDVYAVEGLARRHGIDVITSDLKTDEMFVGANAEDKYLKYVTFEKRSVSKAARANIQTMINHPIFQDETYLQNQLHGEIGSMLDDLKGGVGKGRIGGGFRAALQEMLSYTKEELEAMDPPERVAVAQQQKYARQLMGMLEAGINPGQFDFTAKQFINAYLKGVGRYRGGHFGKSLEGIGPDLALRFPMQYSLQGYITSAESLGLLPKGFQLPSTQTGGDLLHGMLSRDTNFDRFLLNGRTMTESYAALGGFDEDDMLVMMPKYDSTTKRLIAFTSRNPNELGEYMLYDLNPLMLKNLPTSVQLSTGITIRPADLMNERRGILARLTSGNAVYSTDKNRRLMERLNELNGQLDLFFTENLENVNLTRLARGTNWIDPKMQRFNAEGYSNPTMLRGFGQVNIEGLNDATWANLLERTGLPDSHSIFNFTGAETTSPFFQKLEFPAAGKAIKTPLSQQQIVTRAQREISAQGMLGRYINQKMAIDDAVRRMQLDDTTRGAFQVMDMEQIIDAAVQTGDLPAEAIDTAMRHNASALVQLALGPQGVRIDPYIAAQRLGGRATLEPLVAAYNRAQGTQFAYEDLLLAPNAPEARMSRIYERFTNELRYGRSQADEMLASIRGNAPELVKSFEPTIEEYRHAQDFLTQYTNNLRRFVKTSDPVEVSAMLDEVMADGDPLKYAASGFEAVNQESLNFLSQFTDKGVVTEKTERVMLAVAKLIDENGMSSSALFQQGLEASVSDIFLAPFKRQRMQNAITSISKAADYNKLANLAYVNREGELQFADEIRDVVNPVERNRALLHQITSVLQTEAKAGMSRGSRGIARFGRRRDRLHDLAQALIDDTYGYLEPRGESTAEQFNKNATNYFNRLMDMPASRITEQGIPRPRLFTRGMLAEEPLTIGYQKLGAQEAAAATSSGVMSQAMKAIDRQGLRELANVRSVRIGAAVAGVLAFGGILYGARNRDRSKEDMQGPPLLPGGSPYETYRGGPPLDMDSIYPVVNNRTGIDTGVLYQIQARGSYDPYRLNETASAIAGVPASSNIHKSLPRFRSQIMANAYDLMTGN